MSATDHLNSDEAVRQRDQTRASERLSLIIIASASVILALIWIGLFFDFTADDAYIVARYAENLIDAGELTHNPGELINALTSPLHALVEAALFALTGHTIIAWKVLALVLMGSACGLVIAAQASPLARLIVFVVMIPTPHVILWTFGGLETPLLLFFITALTVLAIHGAERSRAGITAAGLLAGLAMITRYDAVLYAGPLMLVMVWRSPHKAHAIGMGLVGAALPIAWLLFALYTYGDPLPTSYYYKLAPELERFSARYFAGSAAYGVLFLIMTGFAPLVLALWFAARGEIFKDHIRCRGWLYAVLLPTLLYTLEAALMHMMFAFRLLIPFVGVGALLLADLVECARNRGAVTRVMLTAAGALMIVHALHGAILYTHSVNGVWFVGEYDQTGVRDYIKFIRALELNADDLALHRAAQPKFASRPARVWTRMGGMLPYALPEAYIYTGITAYRHECLINPIVSADYAQLLVPTHGSVSQQLGRLLDSAQLISAYDFTFEGQPTQALVYYLPDPAPHYLPDRIDKPCVLNDE